jgi:C1A family cysteine protease
MEHGRVYADAAEEQQRLEAFKTNMLKAAKLQEENPLAVFGVNRFADLTKEEIKRRAGGLLSGAKNHSTVPDIFSADEVASTLASTASVNWVTKGAVTAVKDQGDCGGCWSFATTGNIESQAKLAGYPLTPLSEQELLSCDDWFPCSGCSGGEMSCAFQFLQSSHKGAIATEKSYPYTSGSSGKVASCKGAGSAGATITGSKDLPTSEAQMATWVATKGPIAIGAHADPWLQYKGGIFSGSCSGDPDHAILIVGYGTDAGQDYWLIKNSWGASWGDGGYIKLVRTDGDSDNCGEDKNPSSGTMCKPYPKTQKVCGACGILSDSSYPTGAKVTTN